jgi:hypothetical protein
MTATATAPVPVVADTDDVIHWSCCDDLRAVCGAEVDGDDSALDATCVVCIDLEDLPCPSPTCDWKGFS